MNYRKSESADDVSSAGGDDDEFNAAESETSSDDDDDIDAFPEQVLHEASQTLSYRLMSFVGTS